MSKFILEVGILLIIGLLINYGNLKSKRSSRFSKLTRRQPNDAVQKAWEHWEQKYGKQYSTELVENARYLCLTVCNIKLHTVLYNVIVGTVHVG